MDTQRRQTAAPTIAVAIEPWADGDLELLARLVGDPEMMRHLGGPESPERIRERHTRYLQPGPGDRMFRVVEITSGAAAGSVGYWPREWRGEAVQEIGWAVVPEFQGLGIAATAAASAIAAARRDAVHRLMHAFPAVANAPSNAVCDGLGFALLGEVEIEYPPGSSMTCNDWRLDLREVEPLTTHRGAPG